MFTKASRLKLRYATSAGQVSTEDLWDLPLSSKTGRANLDEVAKDLHRQLKSDDNVSFVTPEPRADETVQLKFDIVKHIIDVKLAENKRETELRENREKKQKILSIISHKEDEKLSNASVEELRAMVDSLQ